MGYAKHPSEFSHVFTHCIPEKLRDTHTQRRKHRMNDVLLFQLFTDDDDDEQKKYNSEHKQKHKWMFSSE